ncbi:hypothetical protein COU75_01570 [Candidatus Peregrinibacteria bacterium CG10_big_fil_rev_8_21_14_0_10_42_8]|nr:MAG: hypothetical protein COU75_01570 [Candidatus Peregrinibacteria bacterium CG10_big_fil_rev_8_21_14_0_10_42_8]
MSSKLLIPLFALAILLSACSSTVITEEEREVPTEDKKMEESTFTGTLNENVSKSFIAFTGTKGEIVSHECQFNEFTTSVNFVEGKPVSLEATIQIDSLETESEGLTKHLLSPDFFESETYGTATFVSSDITMLDNDSYAVTGMLTIKDVSTEVVITMNITEDYVQAKYTLDRTEYNVGGPADSIKAPNAEILIELKVELQ